MTDVVSACHGRSNLGLCPSSVQIKKLVIWPLVVLTGHATLSPFLGLRFD